jgi:glycosyltransferase involved in cell wall biosynthesis
LRPQLEMLSSRGWQVHLVTSSVPALSPLRDVPGIRVHEIGMIRRASFFADLTGLIRWTRLLRQIKPDVVLVSTPKASLLGLLSARLTRVPCRIYHARGLRLEGLAGLQQHLGGAIEKVCTRSSTAVVCDSESLLTLMRELKLLRPFQGVVLGRGSACGVNTQLFHPKEPNSTKCDVQLTGALEMPVVIGFVGRVCADKGISELIAAVSELRKTRSDISLTLVGELEEPEVLEAHSVEIALGGWIRIEGARTDIPKVMRSFTIFCLPSHREGMPISILEAMSCGLAVVTTNATGCRDLIENDVNGFAVPVGDVQGLTRALLRLAEDSQLRESLGANARELVVRDFEQAQVNSRFIDFIEDENLSALARVSPKVGNHA